MVGKLILLCLILLGVFFIIHWIRKKFKVLNLPAVFFVSGAVKSGKTLLSVHLAIKEYKRALRNYWILRVLNRIFLPHKYKMRYGLIDEYLAGGLEDVVNRDYYTDLRLPPMLYSNIPLAYVKYNPLTIDIISRSKRIPNKSVVLIDEVSLFADSQLFKDQDINHTLMQFYKLFGHYSHGGKLIVDSQAISDNHYSMKRCMSSYLYIKERKKLPFISILYVRECIYSDDSSVVNNFDSDIDDSMKKVIIWNKTYDKYDCYCYSIFTDYLPYQVRYDVSKKTKNDDLKCYNIVTLNDFILDVNSSIIGKYQTLPHQAFYKDMPLGDYYINEEGVVVQNLGGLDYEETKEN